MAKRGPFRADLKFWSWAQSPSLFVLWVAAYPHPPAPFVILSSPREQQFTLSTLLYPPTPLPTNTRSFTSHFLNPFLSIHSPTHTHTHTHTYIMVRKVLHFLALHNWPDELHQHHGIHSGCVGVWPKLYNFRSRRRPLCSRSVCLYTTPYL